MLDAVEADDHVGVTVRPEHICSGSADEGHNRLNVVLADVIYNGEHFLLSCRLVDGAAVVLKAPGRQFDIISVRKGECLSIAWFQDRSRAFKVEGSSGRP